MKRALLVAGLAYGDEGKGATVDFLTRKYQASLVVRYNGGAQAAHNVVTPEGQHHTFAQFGSGTLAGAKTHLSRFMMVNPSNMLNEARHLEELGISNPLKLVTIDPWALITTPFHRALNRLEQLASGANNTCGMGIGWTKRFHLEHGKYALFAADTLRSVVTKSKLKIIQEEFIKEAQKFKLPDSPTDVLPELMQLCDSEIVDYFVGEYHRWAEDIIFIKDSALLKMYPPAWNETIIFEGAQGVLLDENHGDPGFNTWTDTTFNNAQVILKEAGFEGEIKKIGVIRSYMTRHGDGPFRTENDRVYVKEKHNNDSGTQGKFRRGMLDLFLIKKAIDICHGIDWLAVNHLDVIEAIPSGNYIFTEKLENNLGVEIKIRGYGPTAAERVMKGENDECRIVVQGDSLSSRGT